MPKKVMKVIGILTADWHLSDKPPILRSIEPDWYMAMTRPLLEIKKLSELHDCPVYHAGDIFDTWNQPPGLIYYAVATMQLFDAFNGVPGQHDIPHHNPLEMKSSAFGLLEYLGYIERDGFSSFTDSKGKRKLMRVEYVGYGEPVEPAKRKPKADINLLVIHKYVWTGEHRHEKAKTKDRVPKSSKQLIEGKLFGYDVIAYGDNHDGFITHVGKTTIFNCGTILKRSRNELPYSPQVGLLLEDGTVKPHFLDTSEDVYLVGERAREKTAQLDVAMLEKFKETMDNLGASAIDILQCWNLYCQQKEITTGAHSLVQELIDEYRKPK